MICNKCKKDIGSITTKDKTIRNIVFAERFMGNLNPIAATLPEEAKKWCGQCIRDFLLWDQLDLTQTITKGVLIYKEAKK